MKPSITWFFQYKFANNLVSLSDIQHLDDYFCDLSEYCFNTLQNTPEISKTLDLSVFFVHYLLNRLQHFRNTLHRYTQKNLRHNITPKQLSFNIENCQCILCRFPHLQINIVDTSIETYYKKLSMHHIDIQKFMLAVLEKCFDVQCIHTMFLQKEYPHLDYDTIEKYVNAFESDK